MGDGIQTMTETEIESLVGELQRACSKGKVVHFIPASGAATRMAESYREMKSRGDFPAELSALFHGQEADWASLPKALVPFHQRGNRVVTPLEEHIREGAALAGPQGLAKLHFTLSPEHVEAFLRHLMAVSDLLQREGIRAEVSHSIQAPATQTLALDEKGEPFRDASGNLVLRPGGHGALLQNLEACGAEFAWIRNIDNIPVERIRVQGRRIRQALAGLLIRKADDKNRIPNRPLRVCAMVLNTGEPGGGPFWIQAGEGETIRIVETVEMNGMDPDQNRLFRTSTHFNPTDMVCALRDPAGKPYHLLDFADTQACFIANKTFEGRPLRALEWPGLWNGSMAGWDTACVEIPLTQFAPVKNVMDFLRPEHQG